MLYNEGKPLTPPWNRPLTADEIEAIQKHGEGITYPFNEQQQWTLYEYANTNAAHILSQAKKIHKRSIPYDTAAELVAAHNAALAAAEDKLQGELRNGHALYRKTIILEKQLAAERQRREQADAQLDKYEERNRRLRDQLLAVQAAIAHANRVSKRGAIIETDLSVLRQHDAEVCKPLVEVLEYVLENTVDATHRDMRRIRDKIHGALAQYKIKA